MWTSIHVGRIESNVDWIAGYDITDSDAALDTDSVSAGNHSAVPLDSIVKNAHRRPAAAGIILVGQFLQGAPVHGNRAIGFAEPSLDHPVLRTAVGAVGNHPVLADFIERRVATR